MGGTAMLAVMPQPGPKSAVAAGGASNGSERPPPHRAAPYDARRRWEIDQGRAMHASSDKQG